MENTLTDSDIPTSDTLSNRFPSVTSNNTLNHSLILLVVIDGDSLKTLSSTLAHHSQKFLRHLYTSVFSFTSSYAFSRNVNMRISDFNF